jgi:hypothetical protein
MENNRCLLYVRYDASSASLTNEARQKFLDNGTTSEEIDEYLKKETFSLKDFVGKDSTCRYPLDDLIKILVDQSKGEIEVSMDHNQKYQCTGSLYDQP